MRTHGLRPYTDRVFAVSPLASVLALVAAGLLALGIARSELASLLWGGTFLCLLLFALLAGLLQRSLISRRRLSTGGAGGQGALEAAPEPRWAALGDAVSLLVSGRLEAARIPGVRVLYAARWSWKELRSVELSCPLAPRASEARGSAGYADRGLYRPVGARILVTDALGFFRFSLEAPKPASLTVAAQPKASPPARLVSYTEGEEPLRSDRRIRTEELLEVRRYVPGDDVRRINWKQYARWEELFLRIGEEVPPASQEVTLILRATPSLAEVLPTTFALGALDRAVSILGNLAASFSSEGRSVRILLGDEPPRAVKDVGEPEFLRFLADAGWSSGRLGPATLRASRCVIVALPDPGLASYLREMSRATALSLLLVEPPAVPGDRRTLSWLLRPEDPELQGRPGKAARSRYITLLESAIVGLDGKVKEFHRV